jgi:hypothetical protein
MGEYKVRNFSQTPIPPLPPLPSGAGRDWEGEGGSKRVRAKVLDCKKTRIGKNS